MASLIPNYVTIEVPVLPPLMIDDLVRPLYVNALFVLSILSYFLFYLQINVYSVVEATFYIIVTYNMWTLLT